MRFEQCEVVAEKRLDILDGEVPTPFKISHEFEEVQKIGELFGFVTNEGGPLGCGFLGGIVQHLAYGLVGFIYEEGV
jgi:hypothetical protein